MSKYRPYVLPAAIVLGLLLHSWAGMFTPTMPFVIFAILLLNFSAVDLRCLTLHRLDCEIMLFQTVVSLGGYCALTTLGAGSVLAQGWLIGVLCPVAASVVVVCSALGADRRRTTGYTIYGNLLVTIVAPIYFSFIGTHQDLPFLTSAWIIFRRTASVIALPFFVSLLLQVAFPKVKSQLAGLKEWALPLWAFALFVTLGGTIDQIIRHWQGNEHTIVLLALMAVVLCTVQFGLGKLIGCRHGQTIAGGQLTGQKNVAMGVWMATMYLHPLTTVPLAFYSISQNIFNSWQMWAFARKSKHEEVKGQSNDRFEFNPDLSTTRSRWEDGR